MFCLIASLLLAPSSILIATSNAHSGENVTWTILFEFRGQSCWPLRCLGVIRPPGLRVCSVRPTILVPKEIAPRSLLSVVIGPITSICLMLHLWVLRKLVIALPRCHLMFLFQHLCLRSSCYAFFGFPCLGLDRVTIWLFCLQFRKVCFHKIFLFGQSYCIRSLNLQFFDDSACVSLSIVCVGLVTCGSSTGSGGKWL